MAILGRSMAQMTGEEGMTRRRWIKAHPDQARDLARQCRQANDRLGRHLYDLPKSDISLPAMAAWIQRRIWYWTYCSVGLSHAGWYDVAM
jgi:hypothetical protein